MALQGGGRRPTDRRAGGKMFDAEKLRAIPIASVATALGFQLSRGMARCRLRSEEHTSELQSLMRISYAVFCLKKKKMNRHLHVTTEITKKLLVYSILRERKQS